MNRIAIVGGRLRLWKDPKRVKALVYSLVEELPTGTLVISGESPGGGVDAWAKEACKIFSYNYIGFPPNIPRLPSYKEFREACYMRNQLIVNACDQVIAVIAQESRGTHDTVRRAKLVGKPVKEIWPEQDKLPLETYRSIK